MFSSQRLVESHLGGRRPDVAKLEGAPEPRDVTLIHVPRSLGSYFGVPLYLFGNFCVEFAATLQ